MSDKLVVFDWGGILINPNGDYPFSKAHEVIEDKFSYLNEETIQRVMGIVENGYYNKELDRLNEAEARNFIVDLLIHDTNVKGRDICKVAKEIEETYCGETEKFCYFDETLKMISELNNIDMALLSNCCFFDMKSMYKNLSGVNFKYWFCSYILGTSKPDIKIYKILEVTTHTKPEDILFFDDNQRNIDTAKECGWNAYKITGNETERMKNLILSFIK